MAAQYCCDELKIAGKRWISAVGTDVLSWETERLKEELRESILPVDDLIRYCRAQRKDWFSGAEEAETVLAHAEKIKADGATTCDCEACQTAVEVLHMLENEGIQG